MRAFGFEEEYQSEAIVGRGNKERKIQKIDRTKLVKGKGAGYAYSMTHNSKHDKLFASILGKLIPTHKTVRVNGLQVLKLKPPSKRVDTNVIIGQDLQTDGDMDKARKDFRIIQNIAYREVSFQFTFQLLVLYYLCFIFFFSSSIHHSIVFIN